MVAVLATILAHRSVRSFRRDPLPATFLENVEEVLRRGPTSSALQAYSIVLVDESDVKRRLRPHVGGQPFTESCPLFVVACADLRRYRNVTLARDYPYRADDLRSLITAVEDISIALQNLSLFAQSMNLGTVMIGGVLNGAKEVASILGLPERIVPVLGLCIGYPVNDPLEEPLRPRLPKRVTFQWNRFSLKADEERSLLESFDRQAASTEFYVSRRIPYSRIGLPDELDRVPDSAYGWSEHVARKQARSWWNEAGPKLRSDLRELGVVIGESGVDDLDRFSDRDSPRRNDP